VYLKRAPENNNKIGNFLRLAIAIGTGEAIFHVPRLHSEHIVTNVCQLSNP
jgi:hypothetical protein